MADNHRVANIRSARAPIPIEVRVIRKWKPYANGTRLSYLLLDKYGDGIQALIEQTEDERLAPPLGLMGCYRLEVYNPIPCPGMYRVALHTAAIRIDSDTPFIPINDDGGIPTVYYNFAPHEALAPRANTNRVLTDYLGMIYSIQFGGEARNAPAIRLNLEDTSGQRIQLALWPEIAAMLDVDRLLDSNFKLILAAASVRVTTFFGKMQLESTSATRLEIEPELEVARTLRVMYHSRNPVDDPEDILSQKIQVEAGPAEKNRMTVAELLERELHEHRGMAYTCDATITAFAPDKTWRYATCPICSVTMDPQEGGYVCTKHRVQDPNYKYCLKCDISDGSGTVSVTIFDQPMSDMLGVSCNDMVRVNGNDDPITIPTAVEALMNQHKIFQLNNATANFSGNLRFTVNRVFSSPITGKRQAESPPQDAQTTPKKAVAVQDVVLLQQAALAAGGSTSGTTHTVDTGTITAISTSATTPPDVQRSITDETSSKGKAAAADTPRRQTARQLFKDTDDETAAADRSAP